MQIAANAGFARETMIVLAISVGVVRTFTPFAVLAGDLVTGAKVVLHDAAVERVWVALRREGRRVIWIDAVTAPSSEARRAC
jgi:hypothetical protein